METVLQNTKESITDIGVQLAGKYLTFALDEEEFAIEILKVRACYEISVAT
jgi:chemotaxis signal transduction protein